MRWGKSFIKNLTRITDTLREGLYKFMINKIGPVTGPRCPEGSRKLRFLDYVTVAQDGGKVVSPTHRPPLPTGNFPGTHFR